MDIYSLSRNFWNFAFDNPEKISPNHAAIFFFALEHCNRLGWKEKFGFPTQMVMDAIGIKKYQTYIRYFNELVEWNFFVLIEKSKNQYSANIISIKSAMPKNGKALDKAIGKHGAKQTEKQLQPNGQSNGQSMDSIDILIDKETILPIDKETIPIGNVEQVQPLIIKSSKNSEKKEPSEVTIFRQVFESEYKEKKNLDFYWNASEAASCKKLIESLKFLFKKEGHVWHIDVGKESLLKMMRVSDPWIQDNLSMKILNSKFNEIVNTLKNGKANSKTGNRKQELAEALYKRFNPES